MRSLFVVPTHHKKSPRKQAPLHYYCTYRLKLHIRSAVSKSQFHRSFSCTGFSDVPCAFWDMTSSSAMTGNLLLALVPNMAMDVVAAAVAGMLRGTKAEARRAKVRASILEVKNLMVLINRVTLVVVVVTKGRCCCDSCVLCRRSLRWWHRIVVLFRRRCFVFADWILLIADSASGTDSVTCQSGLDVCESCCRDDDHCIVLLLLPSCSSEILTTAGRPLLIAWFSRHHILCLFWIDLHPPDIS